MIEAEVHQQLRHLLRQNPEIAWPHQLTMARMVARGLRLERSALIQLTMSAPYRLSYLLPALMWSGPVVLCATAAVQAEILGTEIPWIQTVLQVPKPVIQGPTWPGSDFAGVFLLEPKDWLQARLHPHESTPLPQTVPLLLDGAEQLETWVQDVLTTTIDPSDWQRLQRALPYLTEVISETQVQVTLCLLQRPLARVLLHTQEQTKLLKLLDLLPSESACLPQRWLRFKYQATHSGYTLWATIHRASGQISLHCSPLTFSDWLHPIWQTQPVVIMGEALDLDRDARTFRQRMGLPDLTPLKFHPDSSDQLIQGLQIYTPRLPVPNTPSFRDYVLVEAKHLICETSGSTVVLVSDQPLQTQLGAALAAEFGTRVRVNLPHQSDRGILVCSWDYWLAAKGTLPNPDLLIIITLPFPSTEHPLVASQVEYLRQQGQDWFRSYLLPTAAAYLQRAIHPLRTQPRRSEDPAMMIAILDSRISSRSYGTQLLEALGPIARTHRRKLLA